MNKEKKAERMRGKGKGRGGMKKEYRSGWMEMKRKMKKK